MLILRVELAARTTASKCCLTKTSVGSGTYRLHRIGTRMIRNASHDDLRQSCFRSQDQTHCTGPSPSIIRSAFVLRKRAKTRAASGVWPKSCMSAVPHTLSPSLPFLFHCLPVSPEALLRKRSTLFKSSAAPQHLFTITTTTTATPHLLFATRSLPDPQHSILFFLLFLVRDPIVRLPGSVTACVYLGSSCGCSRLGLIWLRFASGSDSVTLTSRNLTLSLSLFLGIVTCCQNPHPPLYPPQSPFSLSRPHPRPQSATEQSTAFDSPLVSPPLSLDMQHRR